MGFAHIGVLKVVEELGIPTDCVVGTSMGSLVGGLYAIGYDAAALEKIALESDWQSLFIDAVPRSSSSYMEKKLSRPYPASFGFDAKGLAVSSGLSAGQRARDYLAFLTLAYAENTDFSSLPREYRAVATDVSTGAEVVLSKGFLADAMRASMSVPGVFTPHEIDGRFLMDGMLVKNLPVSVAKDLGADLVIAVDIGKMDVAPEEVDNPGASLDRMLSIFINQNRAPERRLADVLIEPDTEGFSSGSFGSAKELIARGEAAARAAMPALRALAERIKKDRPEARARVIGKSPEPVKIGRIEVRGVAGEEAAKLKAAFDPYLGRLTQPEELQAATVRIFSSGDWEFLRFGFRRETDGTVTLVLTAKTKRKPTVLLRIGLGFDGHLGLGADASWMRPGSGRTEPQFQHHDPRRLSPRFVLVHRFHLGRTRRSRERVHPSPRRALFRCPGLSRFQRKDSDLHGPKTCGRISRPKSLGAFPNRHVLRKLGGIFRGLRNQAHRILAPLLRSVGGGPGLSGFPGNSLSFL